LCEVQESNHRLLASEMQDAVAALQDHATDLSAKSECMAEQLVARHKDVEKFLSQDLRKDLPTGL
jgi:predicted transcriptional regulator